MDPTITIENDYFVVTMPAGIDTDEIYDFIHLEFQEGLIHKNSIMVFSSGAFLFVPKDFVTIRELLIKYSQKSKRQKTALVFDSKLGISLAGSLVKRLQDIPFELRVFRDL